MFQNKKEWRYRPEFCSKTYSQKFTHLEIIILNFIISILVTWWCYWQGVWLAIYRSQVRVLVGHHCALALLECITLNSSLQKTLSSGRLVSLIPRILMFNLFISCLMLLSRQDKTLAPFGKYTFGVRHDNGEHLIQFV